MDDATKAELAEMCRKIRAAGIDNINAMNAKLTARRIKRRAPQRAPRRSFLLCHHCQMMLDLDGHPTGNMHMCACGANVAIDPTKPPMLCFFSLDTDASSAGVGVAPTNNE